MKISKKCQYALKALFELAWLDAGQAVKTQSIARAQKMSLRFTEIILNDLKHGGFVDSRRGSEGGYILARDSRDIRIGEVIEYIDGSIAVEAEAWSTGTAAPPGSDAFSRFWREVTEAVSNACNRRTLAELVEIEKASRERAIPNYSI